MDEFFVTNEVVHCEDDAFVSITLNDAELEQYYTGGY